MISHNHLQMQILQSLGRKRVQMSNSATAWQFTVFLLKHVGHTIQWMLRMSAKPWRGGEVWGNENDDDIMIQTYIYIYIYQKLQHSNISDIKVVGILYKSSCLCIT